MSFIENNDNYETLIKEKKRMNKNSFFRPTYMGFLARVSTSLRLGTITNEQKEEILKQ